MADKKDGPIRVYLRRFGLAAAAGGATASALTHGLNHSALWLMAAGLIFAAWGTEDP